MVQLCCNGGCRALPTVGTHGTGLSPSQAAYLAKAGKRVTVFEKRHVLGGAAVTEEIVPGRHRYQSANAWVCDEHVSNPHEPLSTAIVQLYCLYSPGFKFSRASYLLSLLRPQIVRDLQLKV